MTLAKNLSHVIFTGPLFVYVGIAKPDSPMLYKGLLILAAILSAYFVYLIFSIPVSQYHVFLLVHLFLIFTTLGYVGWKGKEAPGVAFSLLIAIGCAAIGYHAIRILQRFTRKK